MIKDEMPDEIWAIPSGECTLHFALKIPFENGVKYVRADLSPPVPDDVAERISNVLVKMERRRKGPTPSHCDPQAVLHYDRGWNDCLRHVINHPTIRAASTPSAEVQALDAQIEADHEMISGMDIVMVDLKKEVQALREALQSARPYIIKEIKSYERMGWDLSSPRYHHMKKELVSIDEALNQPHTGGK